MTPGIPGMEGGFRPWPRSTIPSGLGGLWFTIDALKALRAYATSQSFRTEVRRQADPEHRGAIP